MKEKINIKTLINFSKGKYSYNNYLRVKDWFNNIEEQEVKNELFNQWEQIVKEGNNNEKSLNHIFEKIQYNIFLEEKKVVKRADLWSIYRQVAAILLLPLLAFTTWYFIHAKISSIDSHQQIAQSWVEISAPDAARIEFFLPDSTRGWLNGGSKLKYPTIFGQQRKVELTGEAWFDVKHKSNQEFIVSVPDMDVKVLGTHFNVSAYSEDVFTNVILEKGKVEVIGKTGLYNHVLSPNEKISFNRQEKSLNLTVVDAERFSLWKEGYLILDNERLGDVIGRIERWYNVEIITNDELLKDYRFKATFKDEPLEEVIRLMAKTTQITYEIEKRKEDASGVFKKKRIHIKLKH